MGLFVQVAGILDLIGDMTEASLPKVEAPPRSSNVDSRVVRLGAHILGADGMARFLVDNSGPLFQPQAVRAQLFALLKTRVPKFSIPGVKDDRARKLFNSMLGHAKPSVHYFVRPDGPYRFDFTSASSSASTSSSLHDSASPRPAVAATAVSSDSNLSHRDDRDVSSAPGADSAASISSVDVARLVANAGLESAGTADGGDMAARKKPHVRGRGRNPGRGRAFPPVVDLAHASMPATSVANVSAVAPLDHATSVACPDPVPPALRVDSATSVDSPDPVPPVDAAIAVASPPVVSRPVASTAAAASVACPPDDPIVAAAPLVCPDVIVRVTPKAVPDQDGDVSTVIASPLLDASRRPQCTITTRLVGPTSPSMCRPPNAAPSGPSIMPVRFRSLARCSHPPCRHESISRMACDRHAVAFLSAAISTAAAVAGSAT